MPGFIDGPYIHQLNRRPEKGKKTPATFRHRHSLCFSQARKPKGPDPCDQKEFSACTSHCLPSFWPDYWPPVPRIPPARTPRTPRPAPPPPTTRPRRQSAAATAPAPRPDWATGIARPPTEDSIRFTGSDERSTERSTHLPDDVGRPDRDRAAVPAGAVAVRGRGFDSGCLPKSRWTGTAGGPWRLANPVPPSRRAVDRSIRWVLVPAP